MRNHLEIPLIESAERSPGLSWISEMLETHGVEVRIDKVNWPAFSYQPDVLLSCGYSKDEILLKYRVNETHIRAVNTTLNSAVHKDSCVEFFISTGDGSFYNFEFNCAGTAFAAYGKKNERILLDEEKVSRIRTSSSIGPAPIEEREMEGSWELTAAIPFNIFREEGLRHPGNKSFFANFYKCGDDLPRPHFLSWNPITAEKPDFHLPEFFGEIRFTQ